MQKVHILYQKESIEKIAKQYNLNPEELEEKEDTILNKKYIKLSKGSSDISIIKNYEKPIVYKILASDTYEDFLAKGFDVKKEEIVEDNIILLKKKSGIKHIVRPLENINDISVKYSIDKLDIIAKNNLRTDKLYIGQILWI